MIEWVYHLPVVWMTVVVTAMMAFATAAIHLAVRAVVTEERLRVFKAMSPVMLTPLAVVFGLLNGFLASQVWTEADRAAAAVSREAGALRSIFLLSDAFPVESREALHRLLRRHAKEEAEGEWPAMAKREAALATVSATDSEMLRFILALTPEGNAQTLAQREMVTYLQRALDARLERIIISRSTINWVKWSVVLVLAGLILVTIGFVHADNGATAALAMAVFSLGVAACIVLIASHNRPFTGEISIGPDLLLQVLSER
jgi:hypothetical protein